MGATPVLRALKIFNLFWVLPWVTLGNMVFLPVCFKYRAKCGHTLEYSSLTCHCLFPKCNINCIDSTASASAYSIARKEFPQ